MGSRGALLVASTKFESVLEETLNSFEEYHAHSVASIEKSLATSHQMGKALLMRRVSKLIVYAPSIANQNAVPVGAQDLVARLGASGGIDHVEGSVRRRKDVEPTGFASHSPPRFVGNNDGRLTNLVTNVFISCLKSFASS